MNHLSSQQDQSEYGGSIAVHWMGLITIYIITQ